ncbi:MAG: hypothetical protein WBQ29_18145, partial [Isosphaeraceae bacterium]
AYHKRSVDRKKPGSLPDVQGLVNAAHEGVRVAMEQLRNTFHNFSVAIGSPWSTDADLARGSEAHFLR